ncbi:hypothetical protein [Sphingomonas sp. BAUL-RG-20F-R05-02]|uniref:hypothetical protein n=1 Tax=Sphingomonas sp. BAUL-RG-20F-R05-02 TaxID=2914830 RepID=UPI001F5AA81E|nr:hypothetical protein [Sphingomonas sp. BAUL-RG-20F-R05-02]
MKKILIPLLMVIGGIVFGAGGGYAAMLFLKPQAAHAKGAAPVATVFVPAGKILAPIVASDGKLSGYANFDVSLEVLQDKSAEVTEKLPLFLNAVNMRTYRSPMASGPQGVLPDLKVFETVLMAAAGEALAKDGVKRAIVTAAAPA